jgi:hypothetical protein
MITSFVAYIFWVVEENNQKHGSSLRSRDSCRNQYKNLKILPLQSQYVFSLVLRLMILKQDNFAL